VSKDAGGAIGIALILGTSVAVMWFLVYVAKVEWFRQRMLHGNRTERAITALPVVVPIFLFFMIIVRPLFP
jgi:hypothetical protein